MYLLRYAIGIVYMILIYSFILVLFFGNPFARHYGTLKDRIFVFGLMILVLVFGFGLLILFSYLFAILFLLVASLLSGFSLLFRSRKSRLDFALLVLVLILTFVLRPITLNEPELLISLTFIGHLAVFWGVIEAAREFVYPLMKKRFEGSAGSTHARTATALFVALFGFEIFAQAIGGQALLPLVAEYSDYAFIAGAVLGVPAFIYYIIRKKLAAQQDCVTNASQLNIENHPNVVYCPHCGSRARALTEFEGAKVFEKRK